MTPGYNKALYLLPFDHRNSYISGLFDFKRPLSASQDEQVRDSKQLIYEGFRQAVADGVPNGSAGILVDEEFGSDILRDARRRGFVTASRSSRAEAMSSNLSTAPTSIAT